MCTMIAEKASVSGSGKGPRGWFTLQEAYISYDHPHHAPFEHSLNLGFVNEDDEGTGRVAVELSRESARELATRILAALERADEHEAA